jgi:hypothetical protein
MMVPENVNSHCYGMKGRTKWSDLNVRVGYVGAGMFHKESVVRGSLNQRYGRADRRRKMGAPSRGRRRTAEPIYSSERRKGNWNVSVER